MALQTIGVGAVANDNTGDPIRDAFVKVNANFVEAYATGVIDSNLVTPGLEDTPSTVNLNGITVSGDNIDITIKANGTGQIILDTDVTRITSSVKTQTATGVTGDVLGDMTFDVNFIYICINDFPNGTTVWARATLATSF